MSDLDLNSGHVKNRVLVSRSTGEAVGIAFLKIEDSSLELADLMWSDELVMVKPVVGSEPKVHILNLPPELLQKKVQSFIPSSFTQ